MEVARDENPRANGSGIDRRTSGRIARQRKGPTASLAPLLLLASWGAVAAVFGGLGLAAHLGQSLVAILLLETVNYLEHYGLVRGMLDQGGYERIRPEHSWNSSHLVSNAYLFNLARHSDHHYLASRPYEMVRHWDDSEAPQLPSGYAAMLMVALVPPLWLRVMDPRVAAWAARKAGTSLVAQGRPVHC